MDPYFGREELYSCLAQLRTNGMVDHGHNKDTGHWQHHNKGDHQGA